MDDRSTFILATFCLGSADGGLADASIVIERDALPDEPVRGGLISRLMHWERCQGGLPTPRGSWGETPVCTLVSSEKRNSHKPQRLAGKATVSQD